MSDLKFVIDELYGGDISRAKYDLKASMYNAIEKNNIKLVYLITRDLKEIEEMEND